MAPFLFLLATDLEAKPLLQDQEWGWSLNNNHPECYHSQNGSRLLITGIGPTRAAASAGWAAATLNRPSEKWLNLGVCGALSHHLQVGEIGQLQYACNQYEEHPFDHQWDKIQLNERGWGGLTLGKALHDDQQRERYQSMADVVDMEIYSLALTASSHSISIDSFKIVSDFSSPKDQHLIVKRIPELMASLWAEWKSTCSISPTAHLD